MADPQELLVAALVILRSASSEAPSGFDQITVANVTTFLPSDVDTRRAQAFFRDAGFTVGPIVGAAFSIEGLKAEFENYFGVKLQLDAGEVKIAGAVSTRRHDLPLDAVPDAISSTLVSVTFEAPVELDSTGDADLNGADI